ncbi:PTS transporter subunit EIIC [Streptomyces sp. NPDC058268]|uniref:PTS transporter subunit EIIC n=1 Tax=Streptomyces sp. NPDC058268 TaxID=3346413 RepID=UPI0036E1B71C
MNLSVKSARPIHESPAPDSPTTTKLSGSSATVGRLRRVGQGLSLPIAAMPTAGLLLRLGQDDMLGRVSSLHRVAAVLSGAGAAVLDFLPLLFAIGLAFGLNRSKDVASRVLGSVVAYLVLSRVVLVLAPTDKPDTPPAQQPYGALLGIVGALIAMAMWKAVERMCRQLPPFVVYAMIAAAALAAGVLLGLVYPEVDRALTSAAKKVAENSVIGGGVFGFLNRLLIPLGLQMVPSSVVWYMTGDCGNGVRGDVPCFFNGHSDVAGIFLGGFFPITMFALPAAALAMWRSAPAGARRRQAAVLLLPAAGLCAATGITEPIELTFAYCAPILYAFHAVLTGVSLALVNALGVHAGFIFSAGAVDFILQLPLATRALLLLPIGIAFGAVYYAVFRFAIERFNLPTPGRGADTEPDTPDRPRSEGAST